MCSTECVLQLGQTAFHSAARKGQLLCLKLLFAAAECSKSLDSLKAADKVGDNVADLVTDKVADKNADKVICKGHVIIL